MVPQMKSPSTHSQGSALLIVLAFLLLLTTLTVAFLSRATFERLLSNASFSQGKVDLAGQGAISAIIGDLQQEIVAGSNVGAGTTIPDLTQGGTVKGYYYPNAPATAIPAIVGFTPTITSGVETDGLANLVKISYPSAFYSGSNYNTGTYPAPNRASSIATTTASLNSRSVTAVRWNKPLLMNPVNAVSSGGTDFTPPSAFTTPDWIYVARDGSNPTSWDSGGSYEYLPSVPPTTAPATGTPGYNPVTQRYAYAIYDEGGTLDLNVAGCPVTGTSGTPATVTYSTNQPYKNALSYADLTQLPGISSLSATQQQAFINAIVGWRNFASLGLSGSTYAFPYTSPFAVGNPFASNFDQNVIFNPNAFLTVFTQPFGASALGTATAPSPQPGPEGGPNAQGVNNQTDNAFTSRQQLLQFILQGLGQNSTFLTSSGLTLASLEQLLPYLGTFSRDISQPSYAPNPAKVTNAPILSEANGGNDVGGLTYGSAGTNDPILNPAFLSVTAASTFTRNDGTNAVVGEPLVKKRFALMRLAWLTYMGPSAGRTIPTSNPGTGTTNYDMWLLVNNYGIPASFLAQGTAANIYKYFGLSWIPDTRTDVNGNNMDSGQTSKWVYNHTQANPAVGTTTSPITSLPAHPASRNASGTAPYTTIYTLSQVAAAGRDPDFVELLKAAICAGSIGKACNTGGAGTPNGVQNGLDVSVDTQIIQTAANIIAQYKTDSYAPRILFDDGNWSMAQEYRGVEDLPYFYRMRSLVFPLADATPSAYYKPAVDAENSTDQAGDAYAPPPTQSTNTALTNSGIGVDFNAVEIWNPHSWNASATAPALTNLRPMSFRMIAIDGPPTIAAPSTPDGNPIIVEGHDRVSPASPVNYESSTLSSTVLNPTVTNPASGNFVHSISLTPSNSGLCFNIPQSTLGLALFREPTMLIKPGIPYGSNLHFAGDPKGAGAGIEGTNQVFNTSQPGLGGEAAIQSYIAADNVTGGGYEGIKVEQSPNAISGDYPSGYTNSNIFLGTYLGSFPMKWSGTDPVYNETLVYTAFGALVTGGTNLTYRLQYLDPNNNWITYDEKYTPVTNYNQGYNDSVRFNVSYALWWKLMGEDQDGQNNEFLDPRTSRFGSQNNNYTFNGGGDTMWGWSNRINNDANSYLVLSSGQNATYGTRIDEGVAALSQILGFSCNVPGWIPGSFSGAGTILDPGLVCQNNLAMTSPAVQVFEDADGIVRRGMSGYVQPTSSQAAVTRPGGVASVTSPTAASGIAEAVGIDYSNAAPVGTGSSTGVGPVQVHGGMESPSFPIMLNRPFRSVADLGYVFSGTPWRNLDMMTPESGAAPLLDVFCINDTNDPNGLVAGKVDLNTRQAPVLQAILAGAYKSEFSPTTTTIAGTGTSPVAAANVIAAGLVSRTTSTTAPGGPLANISELVGKYFGNVTTATAGAPYTTTVGTAPSTLAIMDGSQTYTGFSGTQSPLTTGTIPSSPANLSSILYSDSASSGLPNNYDSANVERYREATIRALSNTTTARVWNLMIDVIAQTGRFPSSASSLANFNVEGERRYWVHVAIDRYTGKVLDEQVEEVKE